MIDTDALLKANVTKAWDLLAHELIGNEPALKRLAALDLALTGLINHLSDEFQRMAAEVSDEDFRAASNYDAEIRYD